MRYTAAAASLLSTVFAFQATSLLVVVVADNIFNSGNDEVDGDDIAPAPTENERDNSGFRGIQRCKDDDDEGCVHGTPGHDGDTRERRAPNTDRAAADMGILALPPITTPPPPSTCFECVGGIVSGDTKTCHDECAGGCCTFDDGGSLFDACDGFTGKVCRDGSCNGEQACDGATIKSVVNSCRGKNA